MAAPKSVWLFFTAQVTYTLTADNALDIDYEAVTDKPTVTAMKSVSEVIGRQLYGIAPERQTAMVDAVGIAVD